MSLCLLPVTTSKQVNGFPKLGENKQRHYRPPSLLLFFILLLLPFFFFLFVCLFLSMNNDNLTAVLTSNLKTGIANLSCFEEQKNGRV
jgi:hypothetical protein